jgi:hypothetical protein
LMGYPYEMVRREGLFGKRADHRSQQVHISVIK